MKVLFEAPHNHRTIWLELTPQKGYYHLIHEVRQSRIRVATNSLKAKKFQGIPSRLVPYLLELDPFKVCGVNYFLCQDLNIDERVSFLIQTYPDWGLNNVSIPTICLWYEQQKHRSFLERIFTSHY